MRTTITTDAGDYTFFVPTSGGYVRLEEGRNVGTLGRQICHGGGFRGRTVETTADGLQTAAERWLLERGDL